MEPGPMCVKEQQIIPMGIWPLWKVGLAYGDWLHLTQHSKWTVSPFVIQQEVHNIKREGEDMQLDVGCTFTAKIIQAAILTPS